MTNAEYHAHPAISASDFRLLEESPLHLENKHLFKLEGKQLDIGSLVHKMVLEPDTLLDEFAPETFEGCDLNKNTTVYKKAKAAWLETVKNKTVVSKADWELAEKMATNVRAIAAPLLTAGVAEESFFAQDDEFGIERKCRPDYYRENIGLVIDLKTTSDGSDRAFEKSLYDYRYHRQAAYYIDTLELAGHKAERFVFITVETKPPFMVRIREIDPIAIMLGRENYRRLLTDYKRYKKTGYASVVHEITLPEWAIKKEAEL